MIKINPIAESNYVEGEWKKSTFGASFSDHMLIVEYKNGKWGDAEIKPYGPISISPSLHTLHYGQAIFEGMKAYKTEQGELCLFRPEENFKRFNKSAERMCMPPIPEEYFLDGLKKLVSLDQKWIPKDPKAALYLRPFMFSSSKFIKASPSDDYTFIIITSPVTSYYSGELNVKIEEDFTRASQGGTGAAKAAGNYAASFYPAKLAQQEGFHQLIWTDGQNHEYIEESGTMNIFFRKDDTLICPKLTDSILPGITRNSLIQLARHLNIKCIEKQISVKEIIEGLVDGSIKEAFGAGTAATVAPINTISLKGKKYELHQTTNSYASLLKKELQDIQYRRSDDPFGWSVLI